MVKINIIPAIEIQRAAGANINEMDKIRLIADMCRLNTLSTVKRAGSGHLGSSFSAMDIVCWLYYHELNVVKVGVDSPDRDVYFSSKGHDVPGLYSVLYALGILPEEKFINLRRLGGTYGHPDISLPGLEANSGSLGMGISKGKGIAFSKTLQGHGGHVFVMTGDGELQEGQNYEALQSAVNQGIHNLTVIVDHNKVQSDKLVEDIGRLRNLDEKFRVFGWHVARCDGHDFNDLKTILTEFNGIHDKPKLLIADTIKGKGISFMEHPHAMKLGKGIYQWHSGAPNDERFGAGYEELIQSIQLRAEQFGLGLMQLMDITPAKVVASGVTHEYVANAFGEALVDLGRSRKDLVVIDADLTADCRLNGFQAAFPDRFIQNGIAEQDMVSMAGGLALQGLLPVVNTFAAFLAARANEQIYTNACEKTKIIYACHYAGLIPAGPGQSHQSIRDISLFGSLPDIEILQPCNAVEMKQVMEYCVNQSPHNCMLRIPIGPSPRHIQLPDDYILKHGIGCALTDGEDALLFGYGPVFLHEALLASEMLAAEGIGLKVISMPWLNRVDKQWLQSIIGDIKHVFFLEDHSPTGGLGDFLLYRIIQLDMAGGRTFEKMGVEGHPACGTPPEVLKFHKLDGASIAERVRSVL